MCLTESPTRAYAAEDISPDKTWWSNHDSFTENSTRWKQEFLKSVRWSVTNANYSPPLLYSPPLVFDSEILNWRLVGPRLRVPTASVHISTSTCHIVVNFKLQTLFVASLEEVKEFFLLYSFFFFFFSGFVLEASGSFASSSFWGFANRNMHVQADPRAKAVYSP